MLIIEEKESDMADVSELSQSLEENDSLNLVEDSDKTGSRELKSGKRENVKNFARHTTLAVSKRTKEFALGVTSTTNYFANVIGSKSRELGNLVKVQATRVASTAEGGFSKLSDKIFDQKHKRKPPKSLNEEHTKKIDEMIKSEKIF